MRIRVGDIVHFHRIGDTICEAALVTKAGEAKQAVVFHATGSAEWRELHDGLWHPISDCPLTIKVDPRT